MISSLNPQENFSSTDTGTNTIQRSPALLFSSLNRACLGSFPPKAIPHNGTTKIRTTSRDASQRQNRKHNTTREVPAAEHWAASLALTPGHTDSEHQAEGMCGRRSVCVYVCRYLCVCVCVSMYVRHSPLSSLRPRVVEPVHSCTPACIPTYTLTQ